MILDRKPPLAKWGEKDTISLSANNHSWPYYAIITLVKNVFRLERK